MAEKKQYIVQKQENGSVMISEDVIITIVMNAVNEVEGTVDLNAKRGAEIADMLGKKSWGKGVKVEIGENNSIIIDCNINIGYGQKIKSVGKAVQKAVLEAVESSTGIAPEVNVNVCSIIRQ